MPSLAVLKNYCDSLENEEYILYLHTKGVSWIGRDPTYTYIKDWKNLMLYFNVEKWKDCINALNDNFETVGVNWNTEHSYPHYSGNFWWAKASYIKKLPKLKRPKLINYKSQFGLGPSNCRLDAEFWLGLENPKFKCLHYSNVNHYHSGYSESNYKLL